MTAKELIEALKSFDPNKEVIVFCGPLQEEVNIISINEFDKNIVIN